MLSQYTKHSPLFNLQNSRKQHHPRFLTPLTNISLRDISTARKYLLDTSTVSTTLRSPLVRVPAFLVLKRCHETSKQLKKYKQRRKESMAEEESIHRATDGYWGKRRPGEPRRADVIRERSIEDSPYNLQDYNDYVSELSVSKERIDASNFDSDSETEGEDSRKYLNVLENRKQKKAISEQELIEIQREEDRVQDRLFEKYHSQIITFGILFLGFCSVAYDTVDPYTIL